ncbi:MAG: glycosyltransferase family 2 protein [Polyangiaceae bacterium]|nr:glycosyltransferase family 2 protein [Polyangiaceae bacterium]
MTTSAQSNGELRPSCSIRGPQVSIVIPVYNEEAILHAAVVDLRERLESTGWKYEIILAENGSHDSTIEIGQELANKYGNARMGQVKIISVGEPNYGKALKQGILLAQGDIVICDEIDLCDVDFHRHAVELLDTGEADLVIGSKLAEGSEDDRPAIRHVASIAYSSMLRTLLGFRGTDTHGLKAFRRTALLDVVRACLIDKDVFASEFVIRADRGGVRTKEVPVRVIEKRPPSINLFKRIPNVLKNVAKLMYAIRVRG